MADFRRILVIFIVTVLFAVFVFSFNAAVNEGPKYEKYCKSQYYPQATPAKMPDGRANCTPIQPTSAEFNACQDKGGNVDYQYDSQGCPAAWSCNTCQKEFTAAQDMHNFWTFVIAAAFGLVAIIIGLLLPAEKNPLNEWIGSGLLLGGLVTLFIGTALSFSSFYKWARPVIILVELLIVIFIAYRKFRMKR